ncbi:hypothetical protein [Gordonia sp. VNK21]|uniref:hypothetical protein n=1 Tax=Gordonia sp. VNK21 TaxID=3382483 RepID=UPI0038D3E021
MALADVLQPVAGNDAGQLYTAVDAVGAGNAGGYLTGLVGAGNPVAVVIVTPGTDDVGLHPRVDPIVGDAAAAYVTYPESFWPIIAGNTDPLLGLPFLPSVKTYQESAAVGAAANGAVMIANAGRESGTFVYTGYSQGAEALGDAAEAQRASLSDKDWIVLVSDPRSPWGIKATADRLPALLATPLMGLLGVENNGARDPGATIESDGQDGTDPHMVSVIVVGDPVANTQWVWYRPVASLLVDLAGFVAIHSPGDGPYGQLDCQAPAGKPLLVTNCDAPTEYQAGNTTYQVYDTYHPLALLTAQVYDAVGLPYDAADLADWDAAAEAFYPMQHPTPGTALVDGVTEKTEPAGGSQTGPQNELQNEPETAIDAAANALVQAGSAGRHTAVDEDGEVLVRSQSGSARHGQAGEGPAGPAAGSDTSPIGELADDSSGTDSSGTDSSGTDGSAAGTSGPDISLADSAADDSGAAREQATPEAESAG